MAVVALPGIKMWAGKQREDQVCTKNGWTLFCSLCQRWPTEGKLQDKYSLLKTLSLTHTHTLTHTCKDGRNDDKPGFCRIVQVHFAGLGFDWFLNNLIYRSENVTSGNGKDMRAVSKQQSLPAELGHALVLHCWSSPHLLFCLQACLKTATYSIFHISYWSSVSCVHHSIYRRKQKRHFAPVELSSLWSYSIFFANSRISCVKFEIFSIGCSCDPSVYHSTPCRLDESVLPQVNLV